MGALANGRAGLSRHGREVKIFVRRQLKMLAKGGRACPSGACPGHGRLPVGRRGLARRVTLLSPGGKVQSIHLRGHRLGRACASPVCTSPSNIESRLKKRTWSPVIFVFKLSYIILTISKIDRHSSK